MAGSGAGERPRRRGKVIRRGLWLVLVVAVGRFLPDEDIWLAVYVLVSVSALFAFLHALSPGRRTVLQPGGSQVLLQAAGDRPLQVIKEIRELLDVEASTARRWVEDAPTCLGPPLHLEQAEAVVSGLRRAGAFADLVGSDDDDDVEVTRR